MGANIKFVNSRFRDAILGHGFQVLLEKHELCICYNSELSESQPTCPYCGGLHYIWRPFGVIPALVVGVKEIRRQIVDYTKVSEGDVAISTLPENKLAINDRIRMVHSPEIYSETIDASYNDSGEKVFIPYYEIAKFEHVTGEGNIEIPLSAVHYDTSSDEIKIDGYAGDRIAIRYKHFPFFLISELLHSNRQQWSGDVGKGTLENLPNQYLGKRIMTKIKTAYKKQLIEANVILDLSNQIQEQSPAYSHEFGYYESYKYAPLQEIEPQYFNIYKSQAKGFYALEAYFVQSENGHILTISDETDNEVEITSQVSSINDIIKFKQYLEVGMKFLLIRNKYAYDFTFTQFRDGSYLTYLGGDIEDVSSWLAEFPNDKDLAVSEFDFVNNEDCEILLPHEVEYVYSEQDAAWHVKNPDITFSVRDSKLILSVGENEIDTGAVISSDKNYLAINLSNRGALKLSTAYLNGETISFVSNVQANATGANKQLTILDENGSLILFRLYDRALDMFEMSQDMNFLQENLDGEH
jgi:hypothetical protein